MTSNTSPLSDIAKKSGLAHADKNRMSEYDIVAGDIKKFKIDIDPKKAYASLIQMSQQPNYRVLRHNNSLLFIDNHQDGTAEGIMFTMDKPQSFVQSLRYFKNGLKTPPNLSPFPAIGKTKLILLFIFLLSIFIFLSIILL